MPENQSGQNPLLVPSIQRWTGDYSVDLTFKILGGMKSLERNLTFLMNVRIYENHLWKPEWSEYWWILFNKFEELIELGMSDELSTSDDLFLRIFRKSLDKNQLTARPPQAFFRSRFDLDPHAYYGMKNSIRLPLIKEIRRKERKHHQAYIGVGYKDKGTARDDSQDASPSWQEITSVASRRSRATTSRSFHLSDRKGSELLTLTLRKPRDGWEKPVKITFKEVVGSTGLKEGYRIYHEDARTLPTQFLDSVPDRYLPTVLETLKTKWTNGKYFLH